MDVVPQLSMPPSIKLTELLSFRKWIWHVHLCSSAVLQSLFNQHEVLPRDYWGLVPCNASAKRLLTSVPPCSPRILASRNLSKTPSSILALRCGASCSTHRAYMFVFWPRGIQAIAGLSCVQPKWSTWVWLCRVPATCLDLQVQVRGLGM